MEENKKQNSYLSFKLGQETFASNVSKVLNIVEMPNITEVPQAPAYMKGVMNLRGTVLPVVDTRVKFGMSETIVTANTCVLVLEIEMDKEKVMVGALVDAVDEVIELEGNDIKPAPSIGDKYNTEFIFGMVEQKESFIMILDMDNVFSTDELIDLKKQEKVETELFQ